MTEHIEGSQFPQTSSTFRCSNKECQDEKDRQVIIMRKAQLDRELMTKKRLEEKQQKRDQTLKIES